MIRISIQNDLLDAFFSSKKVVKFNFKQIYFFYIQKHYYDEYGCNME